MTNGHHAQVPTLPGPIKFWPHTQFEAVRTPEKARKTLDDLDPTEAERQTTFRDAPDGLYRFTA